VSRQVLLRRSNQLARHVHPGRHERRGQLAGPLNSGRDPRRNFGADADGVASNLVGMVAGHDSRPIGMTTGHSRRLVGTAASHKSCLVRTVTGDHGSLTGVSARH
jgi:hypothetical protein